MEPADITPTPTPPANGWFSRQSPMVRHLIQSAGTVLIALFVAWAASKLGVTAPPIPDMPLQQPSQLVSQQSPGPMGWVHDPEAVRAVRDRLPAGEKFFGDTPAGKAFHGNDGTILLSDAAKKVFGSHLPARNQGSVGCCPSFATGTAAEYLELNQIASGAPLEFKPICTEAIYGGSRKQIGGGRIRGDGSVTAWCGQWVKDYGVIPREKVGQYDLTTYSEARARQWGNLGCPKDLEPVAKNSPIKGITFARSADEVAKALRQGYSIGIGANIGFGSSGPYVRDKDGFLNRSGTWGHSQAVIGVRDDHRKGFLFCNSWGSDWASGPTGGYDIPAGCYWVDWDTMNAMIRENDDCVVFSDAVGFPARQLDWFTAVPRPPARKLHQLDTVFALAP